MKCKSCGTEIKNDGISFCPSCGKYLREIKIDNIEEKDNGTISQKSIMIVKDYKPKKRAIVLVICFLLVLLTAFLGYNFISSKNSYYIANVSDTKNNNDETKIVDPKPEKEEKKEEKPPVEKPVDSDISYGDLHGVSKSGYDGVKSSDYSTKIIYDRQYFGQIVLKNRNDVNKIIKYDSELQKNECSSNIRAIENDMVTNYGLVAANLCEMDVDFALELKDVVAYIYNYYPVARSYLTNITLANVVNASYIASFMPIFTFITSKSSSDYPIGIKTQILLNSKYFLNVNKINNSVKYGSNNSYFPPNATRSSTVAHEFGHYLSYVALLKHYNATQMTFVTGVDSYLMYDIYNDFNRGDFSKKILLEAYNKYSNDTNTNIGFDNFRATISVYAMAKDTNGEYIYDETIAEAFHDVYLNKENAKVASRYIVQNLITKL